VTFIELEGLNTLDDWEMVLFDGWVYRLILLENEHFMSFAIAYLFDRGRLPGTGVCFVGTFAWQGCTFVL
jgi:hypothetical protein